MPVEFKILTGARSGQMQRFEQQAVITVGRHQQSDLRFDPKSDLDVSGRHAELRGVDGKYTLYDHGSTNGTYVNGKKVDGTAELNDGDVITFGAKGPQVELRVWGEGKHAPRISKRSTEARIAVAVSQQTKGLRNFLIGAMALVVAGVGAAFYFGRRASVAEIEALQKQIAANDSLRIVLQSQMRAAGDTVVGSSLKREIDDLRARAASARSDAERDSLNALIKERDTQLRGAVQMGMPAIFARNSSGVTILVTETQGVRALGTGFSLSKDGWIITNRHNVKNIESGVLASKIAVKFANDSGWFPASIVKVSDDPDVDVALLKMDRSIEYPAISGIAGNPIDATEGHSVVAIGFPGGMDLPMEGRGNNFVAKATLNPGTVSKKTSSILQMDSFAAHGSSGSPVFSSSGLVVGVVYGGPPGVGGKIVYAVPSEKLAAFLPDSLRPLFVK
jgi:pSer/pThr/pTyr-binding forkhead associated (FHA) protein